MPLIINDRLDIALAIDCAGWHGGQSDCPAADARRLLGPGKIIGVSTNTEAELQEVLDQGVADYVGIGPAYDTATKKDLSALLGVRGVARLLGVLGESAVKSVVIGGVGPKTIPNVLRQCAWPLEGGKRFRTLDGLAVVSAIAAAADPKSATEELVRLWKDQPVYPLQQHAAAASPEAIINATCDVLDTLRDEDASPLIHSITNQVVMNDSANLTLAFGGSPIMSASPEEAEELGQHVGALLLNLGTVTTSQVACQIKAGVTANRRGRPVVVDPVGVGATAFRRNNAAALMSQFHASVIKGNAGEIGAIAGSSEVLARGVDSVGKGFADPARVVRDLARREKVVIAMSGVVDYISDGQTTFAIENGHPYQGQITGSGCMATQAIATFAAAADSFGSSRDLVGAVAGVVAYNVAAEMAAESEAVKGPNTFRAALIDACANVTAEEIQKRARVRVCEVN